MTPQEFKAWFDGFTEAIDKLPTQKQWGRIKARVAEIDGSPITYPVYIDRYVAPYPYIRPSYPYNYYTSTPSWTCVGNSVGQNSVGINTLTLAGPELVVSDTLKVSTFDRAEGIGV
jgi:hypothetical protein